MRPGFNSFSISIPNYIPQQKMSPYWQGNRSIITMTLCVNFFSSRDTVLLCSPGWPGVKLKRDLSVSASAVLTLKACNTTLSPVLYFFVMFPLFNRTCCFYSKKQKHLKIMFQLLKHAQIETFHVLEALAFFFPS